MFEMVCYDEYRVNRAIWSHLAWSRQRRWFSNCFQSCSFAVFVWEYYYYDLDGGRGLGRGTYVLCYVPLTLEVSLFRLRSPFSHIVIIICGLVSSLLLLLLLLVAVAGEKGERETTETLRVK